jgi:formylglycine-generating enzyme required for sulfatase activity
MCQRHRPKEVLRETVKSLKDHFDDQEQLNPGLSLTRARISFLMNGFFCPYPTGPKEGYSRMIRGGDWMRPAVSGKSGFRGCHFPPDTRSNYVGFRVALSSREVSN